MHPRHMDTTIDINNGENQVMAHVDVVNNYFGQTPGVPEPKSVTVVAITGPAADAAAGMPTAANLIPLITDWLRTEEGQAVDKALRKRLPRLSFRYEKFVDNAVGRLAQQMDHERNTICASIQQELSANNGLSETQRDMGQLIIRLMRMVTDMKHGATLDEETCRLIERVIGTEPTDDTIADFSTIVYTETFRQVMTSVLRQSLREGDNPILRHVYKNLLDINQEMARHFYGFFTGNRGQQKNYLYIAWTMWGYLARRERQRAEEDARASRPTLYDQLRGKRETRVINMNYTSLAQEASEGAIYFNGSLTDYVDMENNNDLRVENPRELDLVDFFENTLAPSIRLEGESASLPVPSFMPPMKLKPVISRKYIATWYKAAQAIAEARHVLLLGCQADPRDTFFCDMLRANPSARITMVDSDMESSARDLCRALQLNPNRYTPTRIQGHEARVYGNRVTVISAGLDEIDISEWVR